MLSNDTGLEDGFGTLTIFTAPKHGTAVVNGDRSITYTPSNLFKGTDSLYYWISDIHGDYDIGKVVITVTDRPDYQPVANDDARGTEYETMVSVDVLTNDTGMEDTPITLIVSQNPATGTAVVNGNNITQLQCWNWECGYGKILAWLHRLIYKPFHQIGCLIL